MPAPTSPPETVHDVVLLARQGMSRRAIARALKVSRNTVREVLAAHGQKRTKSHSVLERKPASKRPSKLDEHRGKIDALLKVFPDITAQRIFEELKVAGFAGGYTGVKTLVRAVRPRPVVTPSLETTVYGPGEMAENDWSPYRIAFTHAPHRILQGFSYALVNSHRKRYSFHDRADLLRIPTKSITDSDPWRSLIPNHADHPGASTTPGLFTAPDLDPFFSLIHTS